MKIDRIIGKARMLGLSTGDADKSNELLNIANALGLAKNGHYDLEEVENSLDAMLEETNETTTTTESEVSEEAPLQHRNAMDKKADSQRLSNESKNRTQNKVNEGSSKMNDSESEESSSNEEESLDKKDADSKEEAENTEEAKPKKRPFQFKKAKKSAKEGAKEAGASVVNGAKNLIGFIIKHPLIFIVSLVVLIVIILVLIMLFDDEDYTNGYFDPTCDFNLTYVNYDCVDNTAHVTIKDFVIGAAYAYSQDYEFSAGAYKALMIAIKTNTLAAGGYTSTAKSVNATCPVRYQSVPNDVKESLEKYYNSIERYLYISDSHDGAITSLTGADTLNISDEYIEKIANSKSGNYKSILREVYGGGGRTSSSSSTSKIDTSKETIYIGDSRMNGMASYGIIDNDHVVYHGANGYCWFRYNTNYGPSCGVTWYRNATNDTGGIGAINLANQKMKSGQSYNIVIWLGVNDAGYLNNYFEVYKALAEGEWSNHTIYIAQVGPVKEEIYTSTYYRTNAEVIDFNNKMASLISGAGLSNLIYLDLGLTQDSINWDESDGVHYNKSDYQTIFNLFQSSSGISGNKSLYDIASYCEFHKKINKASGCESGWWWPVGEAGNFERGDILTGPPEVASFGNGRDYGWRSDHPVFHDGRWHNGEDLRAGYGMNVIASRGGTIMDPVDGVPDGTGSGCGNYVTINHGDGYYTRYCHLKNGTLSKYVYDGMEVSQGQIIAEADNTGSSTDHHLHFEIWYLKIGNHDDSRDPYDFISVSDPRPTGNCSVKSRVCQTLKGKGYSDNAIAAILANMEKESSFNLNAYGDPDYGGSIGLCQWNTFAGRAPALRNHCPGNLLNTVECQVDYMISELNTASYSSVEADLRNNNMSAAEMTRSFCLTFERPADKYNECQGRINSNLPGKLEFVQNGCS